MRDPKLTVNPAEEIASATLNTTTVPLPPTDQPAPKPQTFTGQDGRTYYKYTIDEQQVVLTKPLDQMTEQDFYDLPVSAYDAQAGRTPNNLTVEFHDPQLAGYWVNHQHKNGQRVTEMRSRGFVPAKKEDMKFLCIGIEDTDGAITQADLILMKISKAKLFMQYKNFMDIARIRGGTEHYRQIAANAMSPKYFDVNIAAQAQREFQGLGPVQNMAEFRPESK